MISWLFEVHYFHLEIINRYLSQAQYKLIPKSLQLPQSRPTTSKTEIPSLEGNAQYLPLPANSRRLFRKSPVIFSEVMEISTRECSRASSQQRRWFSKRTVIVT
jgi:hypothetical protein